MSGMLILVSLTTSSLSINTSDSSGHVRHWHITTGQCLSTLKEDRETLAAAYSPDFQSFVTVGSDCKVHLYDESSLKLVCTFEKR